MAVRKSRGKAAATPPPPGRVEAQPTAKRAAAGSARRTGRLADAVTALEIEREQLRRELAEARARIVELEKARKEALDRIDWALDSLHTLLQRAE